MSTENNVIIVRHLFEFVDEDGTFVFEIINDETIVDDFMTDINRRAEQLDRAFYDFDGAIDTGAESAWVG
jgi:hypothetical protein